MGQRSIRQELLVLMLAIGGHVFAQDGKLVERIPYSIPDSIIAKVRYDTSDIDQLLAQVDVYRITYLSDGLKVKGYLAEPAKEGRYPSVIFNRGGNRDFGMINDRMLLYYLMHMASWGYVVVGSQYRGNDGGEGQDEFGGSDVDDVLNLLPLLAQLPEADTARIGMFGGSRGGLMTYLALTCTPRIKAAVVRAGLTDAFRSVAERPNMGTMVFAEMIPGYALDRDSVLLTRSPVRWAERLCPTTPILIEHGTGDWRVSPRDALDMADALYVCKHPFRLLMLEGADHGLSEFRDEADRATHSFLDNYVRDGAQWPSLEPHGR
jgi:dipeptidyl aminopeptidase/acylaminoacyl peptidase